MEPVARDAFTPAVKQKLLDSINIDPDELVDLGGFESFVFERPANNSILRITHVSHRDLEQIQGELEFVHHLARSGARVCQPIRFGDKSLSKQIGEFIVCQFEKARGATVTESDWQPGLFKRWGRSVAEFHHAAKHFSEPEHQRIDWRADQNLNFHARIPEEQSLVLQQADQCLQEIGSLEMNRDCYGLIHCDAHAGNFFLDDDRLTFFDFDDCCYQWFVFDVATIMFGAVLQPWIGDSQSERETQAAFFLHHFFEGYDSVMQVNAFMLQHMPLFLKLRELSLYAVIHTHMDVADLQDWFPIKFMQGRRERIEEDRPVFNIEFQFS